MTVLRLSSVAEIAQLVEHFPEEEGVAGSNPALGTICAYITYKPPWPSKSKGVYKTKFYYMNDQNRVLAILNAHAFEPSGYVPRPTVKAVILNEKK